MVLFETVGLVESYVYTHIKEKSYEKQTAF